MKPTCLLVSLLTLVVGCEGIKPINLRSQSPEVTTDAAPIETRASVQTELIGNFVNVGNRNVVVLEGVGLVTGLPGTGGDPPVSPWRAKLLDDMRRRGIENPNQILQSRSTALVVVRAYLPYLVKKGDRFDVQVYIPDDADVTNLNGGYLLSVDLVEKTKVADNKVLEGFVYAKAEGPIMVGAIGEDQADEQRAVLLRGRVLQGGVSLKDRDLQLMLRNEYRSEHMSYRIATRVGERYYDYEGSGQRVPLAVAKTNELIDLKLHSQYKNNDERYVQVIRNMALKESDIAERLRIQELHERLHNPVTSELASIQLEAIGRPALDTLKSGLKNPSLEVQFHSAQALAYMGDSSGVAILGRAAKEEPAFRVFALAALAAINEAESYVQLRKLLDEPSAETRYGAFRALRSLDEQDPLVRGEQLPGGFRLHVLDVPAPHMIHMTRYKMAEIVLFGPQQKFTIPLISRAGKDIMVTARAGESQITLSRITLEETVRKQVPNDVAAVIRAATEMGATYPDVAQLLMQAYEQGNLAGRLEFDALPRAGRVYQREGDEFTATYHRRSRIGRTSMAPTLYNDADRIFDPERGSSVDDEELDDEEPESSEPGATSETAPSGRASSADVTSIDETADVDDSTPTASEDPPAEETPAEKPWNNFLKKIYGF